MGSPKVSGPKICTLQSENWIFSFGTELHQIWLSQSKSTLIRPSLNIISTDILPTCPKVGNYFAFFHSSHRERKFDQSNFSSQNFLMVPISLQYFWVSKAKLKWHTLCYMFYVTWPKSAMWYSGQIWGHQRVTIYVIFLIILTFFCVVRTLICMRSLS